MELDGTGAFILAPLPPEEPVYLKGIPGFELPSGKCLRLKKEDCSRQSSLGLDPGGRIFAFYRRDACLHLVVTKPPLAALLLCVGE